MYVDNQPGFEVAFLDTTAHIFEKTKLDFLINNYPKLSEKRKNLYLIKLVSK